MAKREKYKFEWDEVEDTSVNSIKILRKSHSKLDPIALNEKADRPAERRWKIFRENNAIEIERFPKFSKAHDIFPFEKWDEINVPAHVRSYLRDKKIAIPWPIQMQIIPILLERKHVLGISETGSGKTLAYALPCLLNFMNDHRKKFLILLPTRELAIQVFDLMSSIMDQSLMLRLIIGGVIYYYFYF